MHSTQLPQAQFEVLWRQLTEALVALGQDEDQLAALKDGENLVLMLFLTDPTLPASDQNEQIRITNKSTIDEAKRLQEEGNAYYKGKKYKEALESYTKALLLPSLPAQEKAMLHSNRSATYCALRQYRNAIKEADKAAKLWPTWVKPYFRKGMALHEMKKYEKAIKGTFKD